MLTTDSCWACAIMDAALHAADLPRVFDPFFTTGRAQGGTGLGLAIVRNLVRDGLGGSVQLTSEPGAGTRVTIHLPAAAPPPAS